MSNYIEYNDTIAFHPGYYIKELVDESGLTQEDFAKRLDTTPKNLSLLIRGEQTLTIDIAMKLSRMLGTSVSYWLRLQNVYDSLVAEFKSQEVLIEERKVFDCLEYKYFKDNFDLPNLPRQRDEQIARLRSYLNVASLGVFKKRDMAVSFKSSNENMSEANIIKANIMVQLAINKALSINAPKYNKAKFVEATRYALTLTKSHQEFYPKIRKAFEEAGVILIILPNLPGSKINGATKKLGNSIMLMVNDRRLYSDTFWFTLFHEIGHIINGDFGITFDSENYQNEDMADKYAADALIPPAEYQRFINSNRFDIASICDFANQIERDPGIVLGRLLNDKKVEYTDKSLSSLRHQYKIKLGA